MSYHRPQDPYIHSNASQYDQQYQQQHGNGGYSDYGNQGAGSAYGYGSQTPQSDHYYKEGSAGAAGGYAAGSGHNPAQASAAKYAYAPPKKGKSKWVKYGIPAAIIAILIIAGAVLGGIFGSKASKNNNASTEETGSSTFSGTSGTNRASNINSATAAKASSAATAGGVNNIFYQGTDLYGNPAYPKDVDTSAPTSGAAAVSCADPNSPSGSTSGSALRAHPRLMAPGYQWDCMPDKIAKDAYLTVWNATIFQNATAFFQMSPTNYSVDGTLSGSGILDPARELQLRVKTWAYAYKMSNDTKWLDRTWKELQVASGNDTTDGNWNVQAVDSSQSRNDTWNPEHFLDLAEATTAFAIAYDWLYDAWSTDQRTAIMWTIITLGLNQGLEAYTTSSGWWRNTNGNWNCVCNAGLLLGSLAIADEDPTNVSSQLIGQIIENMKGNCMQGAYDDGTWSETANYWYFGTNAQARAMSSLITATGNDQGLMASNAGFQKTGLFHMYVGGMAGLYAYGDNGPNKFSTNANGMFLWASQGKQPIYALYQRDRADAADPLSMFWYDTSSKGAYWNGLALDQFFDNELGSWGSMRSSWTDFTGTYIGIKSSNATGHQTHGDLDAGDFVIDALGTRWAGEYGSGNYLSTGFFSNETQGSDRWMYFRKGTQGQNTLVINNENQQASCKPVNEMKSSGAQQSGDVDYVPGTTDVAYFKTDMSSCYSQASGTVVRGIRFLNGRRQILVQDEIGAGSGITSVEWRVQTNGTISPSDDKKNSTLTIDTVTDPNAAGGADALVAKLDKKRTMVVKILNPTDGEFSTNGPPASRIYGTDPNTKPNQYGPDEDGDQENVGVTTLSIKLNSPTNTKIQVLWQPQWDNLNSADSATPKDVALSSWSVTSHN